MRRLCCLLGLVWSASFTGCESGVVEPEPQPPARDPIDYVDPMIGTGGGGWGQPQTFVGPTLPFAMARPGPDSSGAMPRGVDGFAHTSGYWFLDRYIDGFSQVHFSGTGIEDFGNFLLMPTRGSLDGRFNEDGYKQEYRHNGEEASVGRYAVHLLDFDVDVELAATLHGAVHHYTWGTDEVDTSLPPALVLDVGHGIGRHGALDGSIVVDEVLDDDGRILVEGHMLAAGRFTGENGAFDMYFSMALESTSDLSDVTHTFFVDEQAVAAAGNSVEGADVGVVFTFAEDVTDVVVRAGVSYISVEQARLHREQEVDGKPFDDVVTACRDAWRTRLDVVDLDDSVSDDERTMFTTALYHAQLMPSLMSEFTDDDEGRYVGLDRVVHNDDGVRAYSDLSMWDTYRTTHPLFTWFYPDDAAAFSTTLTRMADEHGFLPRWPLAVNETGTMLGAPATIILADTLLRGVDDFDVDRAWQAMLDDARFVDGKTIRGNTHRCHELGWCPADEVGRGVANAIEYAWADFALAYALKTLPQDGQHDGEEAFASALVTRSQVWQGHFDDDTGFLRGRTADGAFTHADDFEDTAHLDDYAEGNAWQYTFGAFFDPQGLVDVFGSQEAALAKLEQLFVLAEPLPPNYVVDEFRAADPYYWHSNEPDLHAAYMFSLLGAPHLTTKWARWVQDTKHDATPFGLDGNDDAGTLSAWYVWSVLGLYPVAGSDVWVVSPPRHTATVTLPHATHSLTVRTEGEGDFIASITVDGNALDVPWIAHAQLAAASEVVVTLTTSETDFGGGRIWQPFAAE